MEYFKKSAEEKQQEYRAACEFAIQQTEQIQKLLGGNDEGMKAIDGITGYNNDTFDPDPYKSAYKAGKRAVSVILRDMLDRDIQKAKAEIKEKENE